ncbi:hypothetical protein, partial [Vibrio cholerae]|uniref:hypothetical protein n=1 Tax=Vibrio cholerae TaxID=666 RepID=UPI00196622DA
VGETYAMIKALNKLTRLGMPETQCVAEESLNCRHFGSLTELRNKASMNKQESTKLSLFLFAKTTALLSRNVVAI